MCRFSCNLFKGKVSLTIAAVMATVDKSTVAMFYFVVSGMGGELKYL